MRIQKFKKEAKSIALSLFFSLDEKPNQNILYFSGYAGPGVMAVPSWTAPFLIVPEMEYLKAKKTSCLKVYKTDKKKRLLDSLSGLLSGQKIKSIGIEEHACSVALYKRLKKAFRGRYMDISDICDKIRMEKDAGEIEKIKKACGATDLVFSKIVNDFSFKKEKELKEFIESSFLRLGCEIAFPPIVASGKGSSQPHYIPAGKIKKGFLMLDFGAKYMGYCSDMTRMLYIGKPSKKELADFNLVLSAIEGCERSTVSARRYSDLYALSLHILGEKSKYFTHSLGHGLGLEIHEFPSLSAEDKNKIAENVPFTIEPGIYFPEKYGIRIEDTVILSGGKLEILTKSKKNLVLI